MEKKRSDVEMRHNVSRDERKGCDLEEWWWRNKRREWIILEQ